MPTTRSGLTTGIAPADKAKTGGRSARKGGGKQATLETIRRGNAKVDKHQDQDITGHSWETLESDSGEQKSGSAAEPRGREGTTASTILEKGIIYFFFRARVNTDEPHGVEDIARSYMIMHPLPKDGKLVKGPIGDAGNSRLCALPKKVFPQSGRDRWIALVEKGSTSFHDLEDTLLAPQEYETKTAGTRHKPAATPAGEGVYAISSTGRDSHLAYIMTVPDKMGEVQKELGLKERGSFIISTRNPKYPAPKNARLPEGPEYSQQILDGFRGLRWTGSLPEHLNVSNTQFLLIGELSGIEKALQSGEGENSKPEPVDEIERLEHEDTVRMEHLGKDESEAIFADLEIQAKDSLKLQKTF